MNVVYKTGLVPKGDTMKKSGFASGLLFYFVSIPAALWLLLNIPGVAGLLNNLPSGILISTTALAIGLLLSETARRLLLYAGRKRQISNSLPEEQRHYPISRQTTLILLCTGLMLVAALVLSRSPLFVLFKSLQNIGTALIALLGAQSSTPWIQAVASILLTTVGILQPASPLLPRKPQKYKTYSLEMYNPFLSRIPLFSPERFTLRYLQGLIRNDFLNRFNKHTIFAGRIYCLHEGNATVWYVTYDERMMQSPPEQRPLRAMHIEHYLAALRKLEKAGTNLSHTIIADVAAEHHLSDRSKADHPQVLPELGDLTKEEVERITQTLEKTSYDNLTCLDLEQFETDERARQAYEKRLSELAEAANQQLTRRNTGYEINIHRRDRKLTTKVLQFKIDFPETVRKTIEEYGDRSSPQHSLLVASLRGASGEHAEGFDEETETVSDELEGLESVAGGASALDHIQELNPSVQQVLLEAKGFGRVYDMQLGKESYQNITEWLRSGGANPLTGWRLFRCSKVINGDGTVVARRTQGWRDLIPHLLSTVGLGKEWSHVKIVHPSLFNQDKLPLALLALDAFEADDFKNRRRILRTMPRTDRSPNPEK